MILTIIGSIKTYAADSMPGYQNPRDIIIATPKDGFSTTAKKISILGASDYEYPLYMNGQEVERTSYGFFTVYVELSEGKNEFVFENNNKVKKLTVTRKPVSNGTNTNTNSNQTPKQTLIEYNGDVYGVVTSNYAMPRSKISEADIRLMPLTKGTTFRLLGEDGSYYKIADGTYVSKSSIKRYNKKLNDNKVTDASMWVEEAKNLIVSEFTMNVNSLYSVTSKDNNIYLTLYDTIAAARPLVIDNPTVKKVTVITSQEDKTKTYCYTLYDDAMIIGYDVWFKDGVMLFELKQAPHLKEAGSLKGATVLLDAGHGDTDKGALGPMSVFGPTEKDINLSITLYTKEYLETLGAKVILIRKDDTFYSLSKRVETIRQMRPDISVSIHGNSLDLSSDYSKTSGFLTYYSYDLFGKLSSFINDSITEELSLNKRAPRQKSLSLTRFTTCPSVLLETSFLSNPWDYEYLLMEDNQKDFGIAIGNAIKEYLESIANYEQTVYLVEKGDTLEAIARMFHVTVQELADYNDIKNVDYIIIGQRILIP